MASRKAPKPANVNPKADVEIQTYRRRMTTFCCTRRIENFGGSRAIYCPERQNKNHDIATPTMIRGDRGYRATMEPQKAARRAPVFL